MKNTNTKTFLDEGLKYNWTLFKIETEVFTQAFEKAHGEKRVFEAIKGGMKAQASWDKFGIM